MPQRENSVAGSMLATRKQIEYLNHLADRAAFLKMRHPSLIPSGLYKQDFSSITSERATLVIQYYVSILDKANEQLYKKGGR